MRIPGRGRVLVVTARADHRIGGRVVVAGEPDQVLEIVGIEGARDLLRGAWVGPCGLVVRPVSGGVA